MPEQFSFLLNKQMYSHCTVGQIQYFYHTRLMTKDTRLIGQAQHANNNWAGWEQTNYFGKNLLSTKPKCSLFSSLLSSIQSPEISDFQISKLWFVIWRFLNSLLDCGVHTIIVYQLLPGWLAYLNYNLMIKLIKNTALSPASNKW